jgi:hypothetical protein
VTCGAHNGLKGGGGLRQAGTGVAGASYTGVRQNVTRRTRIFVLASAGILVVGLGTGFVAAYMGGFQALAGGHGPDELAYVSVEAQVVAYVNLRQVRGSWLHDAVRRLAPRNGQAGWLQAETGIDLEQDVDAIVASMHGPRGSRPLLLATGRFDPARLEAVARQRGSTVDEYRSVRVLELPAAELAMALVDPRLVVVGSPAQVRQALDVKQGQLASVRADVALMEQVRELDGGHAWAVVRGGANLPVPPAFAPGMPPLGGLTWLTARGQLDGGIRASFRAEATDEASARLLRDAIQSAVTLGRLQAEQQPRLADLVDSIELGGEGRRISLGFAVPPDMIDVLRQWPLPPAVGPAPAPRPGVPGVQPRAPHPGQPVRPAAPSTPRRSAGSQRAALTTTPLTI